MITRDFYYVAPGKHVVHFHALCPSYTRSFMVVKGKAVFMTEKPRGKTLCDHCQVIEKRLKAAARKAARRVK